MRKMKLIFGLLAVALVVGVVATSADTNAQERPAEAGAPGPPAWVIQSRESGEAVVVPENGPPAWVVEAWQNGERRGHQGGPPPHVAARHEMAKKLGLPGPPAEVIEAWENGEGRSLPGPPDFVLDLLGF